MDALALFCNLHGNGPQTLAALREVGCQRLQDIRALDADTLGSILDRDASGVALFVRESEVLALRVEGEAAPELVPLIPHVVPEVPHVAREPEPSIQRPVEAPPSPPVFWGAGRKVSEKVASLASPPRPLAGPVAAAVLELWNTLDGGPVESPEATSAPQAEPVDEAPSRGLAQAELNGLTPSQIDALARVGINTVDALAEADPLYLSKRTNLPYTHLAHLAFLARRIALGQGALFPARSPERIAVQARTTPQPEPEFQGAIESSFQPERVAESTEHKRDPEFIADADGDARGYDPEEPGGPFV